MIIHQIYGIFNDGIKLKEIPQYYKSVMITRQYAVENNIEYKMWGLDDCLDFLKTNFPQYLKLWDDFRYDIQRADFIRYCILYKLGGIYIDCDIHPLKNFNHLFREDYFFVKRVEEGTKSFPYNAVMGSQPNRPIFIKILEHIKESTYEKQKMSIYDKWKGRLVFQTTGQYMLKRVLKKDKNIYAILNIKNDKKKINIVNEGALFQDSNLSCWYRTMMSNTSP